MQKHKVTEEEDGQRLDRVLSQIFSVSRTRIQKLIKWGEILLNEKKVTPHILVKRGNTIQLPDTLEEPEVIKGEIPKLIVLYESDDVLVINKPAGLVVHPATGKESVTLVDSILEHDPSIASVGEDPSRPGIVHRLDKGVSGVMIVAKTQEAFMHLKEQFMERNVEKEYLALVYGSLSKDFDTIRLKIKRSKSRGRMIAKPEDSEDGRDAVTHFDVLDRYKIATYVRVRIETGRTHQIRTHFRAIDHPIVGDELYKKTNMKNIKPLKLGRLFLHAHRLTIDLPNAERHTFETPLPVDLTEILKGLAVL